MDRVLIVEDDRVIQASLVEYLSLKGYSVDSIHSGSGAQQLLQRQHYDLMVLDLGLPGLDGLTLCRWLRTEMRSAMPVIMLTARDTLDDKLDGFSAGTDDYLVKPFAMSELLVRIQALLKRAAGGVDPVMAFSTLRIDLHRGYAEREGIALRLNPKAFALLELLVRQAPGLVTPMMIYQHLWPDDPPDSEVLKTHIYRLRQVVDKPFASALIETVHGRGYRLRAGTDG